jgi:hypothetical protein
MHTPRREPVSSEWSAAVGGLQARISADRSSGRNARGWALLAATCELRNSGSAPADVVLLSRLRIIDRLGVTNVCQRKEDVADMVCARPAVAPGQSVSWVQDGAVKVPPGRCEMFMVWNGDTNLVSTKVAIEIK